MQDPLSPTTPGLLDEPPWWHMYLDPRGRISRKQFWLHGVAVPVAAGVVMQALLDIARVETDRAEQWVNLLLLWPIIVTSAKRWHDRNSSGWWVLIVMVPVVGWLWALAVNGLLRGTPGPNRFGPDPLAANL